MCLAFKKSQRATRKVAKKDITIYKMVSKTEGGMFTLFQNSSVELGTPYTVQLQTPYKGGNGCFVCGFDRDLLKDVERDCLFVSRGLHAFTKDCYRNKPLFERYISDISTYNTVVIKGRIPAGSEYYENKLTGLIVASSMVYDEEVSFS